MIKRLLSPFLGIILFLFFLNSPILSQTTEQLKLEYLPTGSINSSQLIAPPPPAGSTEFQEQMSIVLWLQQTRTPTQVAFVKTPLNLERFAPLLSKQLLSVDGKELNKTLDDVIDEVRTDYDSLKAQFNEPRPFQVNNAVHPVTDARPVASYPSGHAIRATVYTRLLAEIFPEKKNELIELGQQIGYGRVIAGVHYPIDVLAGQTLGRAYSEVIIQNRAFQEAMQRIYPKNLSDP